jgi:2-polyprenyl-3-methyl-5-hydroxy-6-metoxy-1,4-benzoquinol methylase
VKLARPPAARAALRRYRRTSPGTRAHVRVRWLTCPFAAVEAALPRQGRVLEVGCGHGLFALYAAQAAPARQVHGVDIDSAKVAEGRRAGEGLGNLSLSAVEPGWRPDGQWDAIVVVDVLYLLGPGPGDELLAACTQATAAGGRLVVKEIATRPRWKYRLAVGQELAATRLARVTRGDTVRFLPPERIVAGMLGAGLVVTQQRLDRWYPHPHLLLVGERPASPDTEGHPALEHLAVDQHDAQPPAPDRPQDAPLAGSL